MMELINKKIVMTKDIGVHGNLFGGILMAWIDEAAGAFAIEFCRTPHMVTIKVGELIFKKPLKAGNHVRLYGEVERLGNTSLTMRIEVRKLNVYAGDETLMCETSITYVHIDDEGNPLPISDKIKEAYHKKLEERERNFEK